MGRKRRKIFEPGSMLVVDECFATQDDRFPTELCKLHGADALAGFADRWKTDPRPWARQQVFQYLEQPLEVPGHQPLVKRLFKHAEARQDHELMAAFLVAFDRLVRRERKTRHHYDWRTRQSWTEERIITPRNVIPAPNAVRKALNPRTGEEVTYQPMVPAQGRLFRYATRYYLRRRAWRYFRRLGFQQPAEYCQAIAGALRQYRDEDFSQGEHLLECWGLLSACYRKHPALHFGASKITLRSGHSLANLTPAPYFPALWQQPNAVPTLIGLAANAQSRLVRLWAMEMIRREHGARIGELAVDELLKLLEAERDEVQQFGLELLEKSPRLPDLPLEYWLRLIRIQNPTIQASLCDLMARHVARERLTLRQCVELACAEATPVARLGFGFVKARPISSPQDREAIAELAGLRCAALGIEIAIWALFVIGGKGHYDRDTVTPFFDSLLEDVRRAAWQWLLSNTTAYNDAILFGRLLETPYDDVRLRLVDDLEQRSKTAPSINDLRGLWSSVLLGVHRGGRQKLKAVHQLVAAILAMSGGSESATDLIQTGDKVKQLLAILVVAVRSIRGPERRAGLSALVSLVEQRPELAADVCRAIPELNLLSDTLEAAV